MLKNTEARADNELHLAFEANLKQYYEPKRSLYSGIGSMSTLEELQSNAVVRGILMAVTKPCDPQKLYHPARRVAFYTPTLCDNMVR